MQVGDVGAYIVVTILDDSNIAVDLSSATTKQFHFELPDGSMLNVDGSFVTDGKDGQLRYIFQSGDLSQSGTWKYQVYFVISANETYTDIGKFKVSPNLPL